MTLSELNSKIETTILDANQRAEARHLRDERLGILGVHAVMEPTEEQIQIVHDQLFPPHQQGSML